MARENVLWEVADGVGTLTVNRPKQLNALDVRTLEEIGEVIAAVAADAAVRAVVVTGAMSRLGPLEALAVPTVAAVNGFALGGGCELAMACDLVYASERARFGQPEVNLGLVPGFGGTQRLTRRVGLMRAKELVLSGEPIDAATAKAIGLALDVLPSDRLLEHARAKARTIASRGPVAVAQAIPPTRPAQVLLGLSRGASRGPPTAFPIT